MAHERVALIGTGLMGKPMARAIARAGYHLAVWNRTPARAQELAQEGITVADSVSAAVAGRPVVVIMVSNAAAVDAVLFGTPPGEKDCVSAAAAPGTTVIVMSSIGMDAAREQARRLERRGIAYIDAPVSGGQRGAVDASLTIMAGGSVDTIDQVRPILDAMGRVTRIGPVGTGQLTKIANQVIVGVTIAGVAEALLLARKGGADLSLVLAALRGGFADSTILRVHGERMASGNFQPGGHATSQLKDMGNAVELAQALALELPIARHVQELYAEMCAHGLGELDHSGLYRWLSERQALTPALSRERERE